jgi:hypothetical protein
MVSYCTGNDPLKVFGSNLFFVSTLNSRFIGKAKHKTGLSLLPQTRWCVFFSPVPSFRSAFSRFRARNSKDSLIPCGEFLVNFAASPKPRKVHATPFSNLDPMSLSIAPNASSSPLLTAAATQTVRIERRNQKGTAAAPHLAES